MLRNLFFNGSLIGFSIAMPVGPVAMLCIQHSLRRGMMAGLVAGLGAALADAVYGGMAGCGVSMLSHFFIRYQLWFQMIGTVILWYLGFKIFKSEPVDFEKPISPCSLGRIFFSTFALTLTNPFTLICFAGVYTGLGIHPSDQEILPTLMLTLGVLLGSTVWWLMLSCGSAVIGKRWSIKSSPLFNQISGLIILSLACVASVSALHQLLFFQ